MKEMQGSSGLGVHVTRNRCKKVFREMLWLLRKPSGGSRLTFLIEKRPDKKNCFPPKNPKSLFTPPSHGRFAPTELVPLPNWCPTDILNWVRTDTRHTRRYRRFRISANEKRPDKKKLFSSECL